MKTIKGRRDDIFQRANQIMIELNDIIKERERDRGLTAFGATKDITWEDLIEELRPRLEKEIATHGLDSLGIFYIGWWFGNHAYGSYVFKQEQRDGIFKDIADPLVDEMISRGVILFSASDDIAWEDLIEELQPRLKDMIANNELELFDVFYIGWWFGFRTYP